MKDTFDDIMAAHRPEQTPEARQIMFTGVIDQVKPIKSATATRVASPYMRLSWFLTRQGAALVVVCFLVGVSSSVAAAEAAKPGDLLFPLDRATEEFRLFIARDEQKVVLQSQFLDERLSELEALVIEATENGEATGEITITTSSSDRVAVAVSAFLEQADRVDSEASRDRLKKALKLIDKVDRHLERDGWIEQEADRLDNRNREDRQPERTDYSESEYRKDSRDNRHEAKENRLETKDYLDTDSDDKADERRKSERADAREESEDEHYEAFDRGNDTNRGSNDDEEKGEISENRSGKDEDDE